jgi:prevent-host-death family protein
VSTQVPAKEFRQRLAEHLDAARAGQVFEITRSGRPTARLGPINEESEDDGED